jgi:hypothetical protein
MYTIFFAVLHVRQEMICDVMTSFGLSARSAVYYQARSQLPTFWKFVFVVSESLTL